MSVHRHVRLTGGAHGLDTLVDYMREGFALCRMVRDETGRVVDCIIVDANEAFMRGLGGAPSLGQRLLKLRPELTQDWFDTCSAIVSSGLPGRFEYWEPTLNRWFDAAITPVPPDEMIMLYVDVTDRKLAETRALERNQELNHRVKNNLNLVAAMLTLQARGATAETRHALDQAAARVHTISQVHDLLHRAAATDSISLDQYLRDLCNKVQRSMTPEGVTIVLDADDIQVSIEHAVELGVILNELLTNAIKYAYPGGEGGEVRVNSHRVGNQLELTISDDGKGVTDSHQVGLGMKLVRSIVRQNGGECAVQFSQGTHVRICLPLHGGEAEQQRLI